MDNQELTTVQQTAGDFEEISISNGNTHWKSAALREWLGYANTDSFKQVISRAMTVCYTLSILTGEHFIPDINNKHEFKLTRFACYLIAMNGDHRKPQVAKAQVYFAQMADMVSGAMETADDVERVYVRQKITVRNKSLGETAQKRDVDNYAKFQNAGYIGLYNMGIRELKKIKGLAMDDKRTPLDFMGDRELVANLFRITETEGRIKNNPQIYGQVALEKTAHDVGREVRNIMEVAPEKLAQEEIPEDIKKIKTRIKKPVRKFDKMDKLTNDKE